MTLPSDPFILLSLINTKLRDEYPSLQELCSALDIDLNEIESRLKGAGFFYDKLTNQFKSE